MARTTGEVIGTLDHAVSDMDYLYDMVQTALVVGFEQECRMVFRDEPERLEKLNRMVQDGGIPVGLIKVTRSRNDLIFYSKPLMEFKDDLATTHLLSELCTGLGMRFVHGDTMRCSSFPVKYQESHS